MSTYLGTTTDKIMAPLVNAIANVEGVTVISNDSGNSGSPFVFFKAPQNFASMLSVPLVAMQMTATHRPLYYFWVVEGRFREGGELCWYLDSPSLRLRNGLIDRFISRVLLRKKLEADLNVLTNMIYEIAGNLPNIRSGSLLDEVHEVETGDDTAQYHCEPQPHGLFNRMWCIATRAWTFCVTRDFMPTNLTRHQFSHNNLHQVYNVAAKIAHKGFVSICNPKLVAVTAVLLLSACATNTELQKNGTGSNEMKTSPCACDPIPYQLKTYTWDRV